MLNTLLKEFHSFEKEVANVLLQMDDLRLKIREAYGMENIDEMKIAEIPFAAYEMQLERHLQEKKEMEERHLKEKEQIHDRHEREKERIRKHYKNIIMWISIPFIVFLIGVFGSVVWFFREYEFASYVQDGDGLNNIVNESTQGDVTYEPNFEDLESQR